MACVIAAACVGVRDYQGLFGKPWSQPNRSNESDIVRLFSNYSAEITLMVYSPGKVSAYDRSPYDQDLHSLNRIL